MGVAYDNELDKNLKLNIVVQIDGVFYARHEPDSGLSITSEFLQVQNPQINGVKVDVRRANSPISTFTFKLMEFEGNKTSSKIMLDENQFLEKDCIIYLGHITGSFDFSDYIEIARTKISSVVKIANGYSFKSKDTSALIARPALNRADILTTFILPASTSLDIGDTTGWPDSGILRIDEEFIAYASKDVNGETLLGLSRGIEGSAAASHELGSDVYLVTKLEDVNPIDMILQILLSDQGDGTNNATYDVIEDGGLAIDPSNIDITDFENTRDTFFLGELHTLLIWGVDNMLRYLEKFLLPSLNIRFITIEGKIAVSILDQVDFNETVPQIDEDSIIGTPTWGLTSDSIVNVVIVKYDYNFVNGKYESSETFKDNDSIATFGEKRPLTVNMPSVKTEDNGAVIVTERAGRLLSRLSTARGKVKVRCHFDKSNIEVGSNVQIVHRFLPQQGGTLGFSDQLEVMSRKIDLDRAIVVYDLEFTSYTGIRIPFIAPSPQITNVLAQNKVEVTDASCLTIGDRIRLFKNGEIVDGDPTAGSYLPDGYKTVQLIEGNEVTFNENFSTTLENNLWLKVPDYDEATEEQISKYAFIGENTGFFNDGSKSYQIIF